ncbi:hypothetical protein GHT07_17455 [Caenimonas koreensis DSM 17982]|uniref:NAD(P)H-binding n=1 Tax=Caenimonas koreensis DSM 17982 TaxID=1121255 RepID=A0A844BBX0_9BURK|nr:hypothetical protein [Caenimonas koreensis]MRD49066.1 hypothetical protein [Caenimonas koreensis DSM 17982]
MPVEPFQVLGAAQREAPRLSQPRLLIAGATGILGTEVLRRVSGLHRFSSTQVLAREPMRAGIRGTDALLVDDKQPLPEWPAPAADTGLVMFDPPRLFNDRERALWTPRPEQFVDVATWMRRGGVTTLVVVLPHDIGRLPAALKRGLATLDEQSVCALGFSRLVIVRSARQPLRAASRGWLHDVAAWMLSVTKYMVPSSQQPVRAAKVAEFVAAVMEFAPPGIHVASSETVWQAAQTDVRGVVQRWLAP